MTKNSSRLSSTRFTSYAKYITSREWARERSRPPLLLCVTPEIAQERRDWRAARMRIADNPGLSLLSTTAELLEAHGPLTPIWLRSTSVDSQTGHPTGTGRQALFEDRAVKS